MSSEENSQLEEFAFNSMIQSLFLDSYTTLHLHTRKTSHIIVLKTIVLETLKWLITNFSLILASPCSVHDNFMMQFIAWCKLSIYWPTIGRVILPLDYFFGLRKMSDLSKYLSVLLKIKYKCNAKYLLEANEARLKSSQSTY